MASNSAISEDRCRDASSKSDFKLIIRAVTWNVAMKSPSEDLSTLLIPDTKLLPDVLVVGFQEYHQWPLNQLQFQDNWTNECLECLLDYDYFLLKQCYVQSVLLNVFVRKTHLSHARRCLTDSTNLMLWLRPISNKGAVSVSLNLYGCRVCFVNCHLAPYSENSNARNEAYHMIKDSQRFNKLRVLDHRVVIWIGDLNYRVVANYDTVVQSSKAANESRDFLMDRDQLNFARETSAAFDDLTEGAVSFPPTYKFDIGTDNYDTSLKRRIPSYCDRILYRDSTDALELLSYQSIASYRQSDHKPVVAQFSLMVPINTAKSKQPIKFSKINYWYNNLNLDVFYNILDPDYLPSTWDWIGLYKADFMQCHEHVTYCWCSNTSDRYGNYAYHCVIPETTVADITGSFCLAYYSSSEKNIIGLSDKFFIVTQNGVSQSFQLGKLIIN